MAFSSNAQTHLIFKTVSRVFSNFGIFQKIKVAKHI
jgi:hypothetical protein